MWFYSINFQSHLRILKGEIRRNMSIALLQRSWRSRCISWDCSAVLWWVVPCLVSAHTYMGELFKRSWCICNITYSAEMRFMNLVSIAAGRWECIFMHACFSVSFSVPFTCPSDEASEAMTVCTCWVSSPFWIHRSNLFFPGKGAICAFLYCPLWHCSEVLQFGALISVRDAYFQSRQF